MLVRARGRCFCVCMQEKGGSLYKLTIDVMETKCHITSRKSWKQCEIRSLDEVPVSVKSSTKLHHEFYAICVCVCVLVCVTHVSYAV